MDLNCWWEKDQEEIFWLENTRRKDIGADLHAPMFKENGHRSPFWELLREPREDDVVFHYSEEGIVGYSYIRGEHWEDEIFWSYPRPGIRRGLSGYTEFSAPIPMKGGIDLHEREIFRIREELQKKEGEGKSLYFPFQPYKGRSMRAFEGYFTKLPKEIVYLLGLEDSLSAESISQESVSVSEVKTESTDRAFTYETSTTPKDKVRVGGTKYRFEDEEKGVAPRKSSEVDDALVERGWKGHKATQNDLADWLLSKSIEPLRPEPDDPLFDIAWKHDEIFYVCEVKSTTMKNQENQLRRAIGQVLRYKQKSEQQVEQKVVPVINSELKPLDESWLSLCQEYGVILTWPGNYEETFNF